MEQRVSNLAAEVIACATAEGAVHLIDLYERRGYRKVTIVRGTRTHYNSAILAKTR